MDEFGGSIRLELTATELQVLKNALRLMESTLGHEEADELEAVQALLAKIEGRVTSS